MKENKEKILKNLLPVIQQTRAGKDVKQLNYLKENDDEYVFIDFGIGCRKVDVTACSAMSMLRSVLYVLD